MLSTARALRSKSYSAPSIRSRTKMMDSQLRAVRGSASTSYSSSPPREGCKEGSDDAVISLQEWQGWGTSSQFPALVNEIVKDTVALERAMDAQMRFGGNGGKLQGDFKLIEDKKHRATYRALVDSEKKLQFFAARQIACRLLGSRGYLCQKCWLALEDCMCSKITPSSLWHGIRFWVYMHPKDFLRQNNTGKLLWQVFGVHAATLCLFGIAEHEENMWNAFKLAGKSMVWCLYPNYNLSTKSVPDAFQGSLASLKDQQPMAVGRENPMFIFSRLTEEKVKRGGNFRIGSGGQKYEDSPLNFILIDGTWSNSAAMFSRLKEQSKLVWGEEDLSCISLAMPGVSVMHKLRPQPSWDRTCTTAAAIGLLSELHILPELSSLGLDKQAEAVEDSLVVLLEALTSRRLRMGRSITRKERHNSNIH